MRTRTLTSLLCLLLLWCGVSVPAQTIVVGSKQFTESYVLAEIAKKLLTDAGFTVEHKQGMGATGIVWEALKTGQISCYADYTGTISQELLKSKDEMTLEQMRAALVPYGVGMTGELGFNDGYALVMRRADAQRLGITKVSDLKMHPELKVGLTHEFLERKDGWTPLSTKYGLEMRDVSGVQHTLGYNALLAGKADLIDAYTTDSELVSGKFQVLQDDLKYFPKYKAVFLYRLNMPTNAIAALRTLEGKIDENKMVQLNAEAKKTKDNAQAAGLFFSKAAEQTAAKHSESLGSKLFRWTSVHLLLVGISMFFTILVGIPLGILASRPGLLGKFILGVVGVIQTIPSLALLVLLVPLPFLGITRTTAIVALFLYSLLPIVRNTATGLQDIPTSLRESAIVLGLEPGAQLWKVYLPMASRTILAGIKTSAIINVGTATLAALIGAGGLGDPIISGLTNYDNNTLLQGAIPAAVLALLVQSGFDLLDRVFIPKGLRLPPARD